VKPVAVHIEHAAAENLPRGYVAQREERCRVILIDIEGDAAVENGRVCAAIVMIDVGAGVPARLRGNDTAENVGVAFDPWTGAVLGGSNLRRIRHHEKGEAKCSLTHASPGLCAHHVPPKTAVDASSHRDYDAVPSHGYPREVEG